MEFVNKDEELGDTDGQTEAFHKVTVSRRSLYKKKKKIKKRPGRIERLKSSLELRDDKITKLSVRAYYKLTGFRDKSNH